MAPAKVWSTSGRARAHQMHDPRIVTLLFTDVEGSTPLLASLAVGEMWYRKGSEKTYVSLAYGFAEVQPDSVTVLAELAERADEIDASRAEAARARAEERLARPTSDLDYERARVALAKSLSRLQVSSRLGSPRTGALKQVRTQG